MENSVIFDVDGTIIEGQSQRHFLNYLRKSGVVSLIAYTKISLWFLAYKMGLSDNPKDVMEYAFKFIKGWTLEKMDNHISGFFEDVLVHKIYGGAMDEIEKHRSLGFRIIILSNAIDPIIKRLAGHLRVEDYICTKLEVTNGIFTGKIDGDIVYGINKISKIEKYFSEKNLSFSDSSGYGDHISDVYLLEKVAHPIAVNPSYKLLQVAKSRNWAIRYFR